MIYLSFLATFLTCIGDIIKKKKKHFFYTPDIEVTNAFEPHIFGYVAFTDLKNAHSFISLLFSKMHFKDKYLTNAKNV